MNFLSASPSTNWWSQTMFDILIYVYKTLFDTSVFSFASLPIKCSNNDSSAMFSSIKEKIMERKISKLIKISILFTKKKSHACNSKNEHFTFTVRYKLHNPSCHLGLAVILLYIQAFFFGYDLFGRMWKATRQCWDSFFKTSHSTYRKGHGEKVGFNIQSITWGLLHC